MAIVKRAMDPVSDVPVNLESPTRPPTQHQELVALASAWLRRPGSRGGHGCQVAFTETRVGYLSGESPDAIGFRARGFADGSVLVEVKTSRADFLADAKKPHRSDTPGMGRFRYYMCPEGLIRPDELPDRWGLLYVDSKSRVTPVQGAACLLGQYQPDRVHRFREEHEQWTFDNDLSREVLLLTTIINRVPDAEAANLRVRQAQGLAMRNARTVMELQSELHAERARSSALAMQLYALTEQA